MNDKWEIDGSDIYANYGAIILKGSYNDIMSPPFPKKRLEYNYSDKNGIDVDVASDLVYEPKRYKINVLLVAPSFAEFWSRYNSFFGAIDKNSSFDLYIDDLEITISLLYEGAQCTHKSRSLKNGQVVAVYEISVLEANPKSRIYGKNEEEE